MFSRERLLDLLRHAHQQEITFIDGLSEQQRTTEGAADNWSAKDIIAHLATWKERLLDDLQAAARGAKRVREDNSDDHINAGIYEAHRTKTWDEVRAMAQSAYQQTADYIREASERDLTDPELSVHGDGRAPWFAIVAESVSHAIAHLWDYHLHQGEPERAIALQESTTAQLRELNDPAVAGFAVYNLACVYARAGRTHEALRALEESLRLRPQLTEWSKEDPDLESLHGEPNYQALYS